MCRWRGAALERLPEFRQTIDDAPTIMSLWIELQSAFARAYRAPRDEYLIGHIYAYADWCVRSPSGGDASNDPGTAVVVVFYEHLPELPGAREDMPRRLTYEEVAASEPPFASHIGEDAFAQLLLHMKRDKHKYVAR